jgi:hypothetical protein
MPDQPVFDWWMTVLFLVSLWACEILIETLFPEGGRS